ncbi:hypothetical protein M0208_06255 [Sphingomonas sp. SUN019]|uniref:hypothetical protein n=1 Tax=Sphingomonas sp. SUN019 TaxID=2937788 RepID=UPI002164DAE9|nr:hypothetical protein [Sphingomonas sp. SUN019]UVO50139.1 hypothetical protein M0208_06255 [Sphingomonas sp. SUN019]
MPLNPLPDHDLDTLRQVVTMLITRSGKRQRDLVPRAGLSKDQISRALRGSRGMTSSEALALLDAAGLPARGALTLALYGRQDLASEWALSGLAAFLETFVNALPDALDQALGGNSDRIDPRWGPQAARFVAQRVAHHITDLIEREEKLGDFDPTGRRHEHA